MPKAISVSLSPNVENEDVWAAISMAMTPWRWQDGKYIDKLERYFEHHFGFADCRALNSGRSCLITIFEAIGLKEGDEVIVQSYTCNAVINPIIRAGATPIYVDISTGLNMDVSKLAAKINPRTKAVIAQHTFGMPCDIAEMRKICDRNGIILIEDCAHALGAKYDGKYCGSFGDFSFFSFGRDKVISSVYGGMLVVNKKEFLEKIDTSIRKMAFPSNKWIGSQLLHPIITGWFVLPFYSSKIGKGVLAYSLNWGLLTKSVTNSENMGQMPDYFPKKMPNALAFLAMKQIYKLERYNLWRKSVADYYMLELRNYPGLYYEETDPLKEPIYMRFPVVLLKSEEFIEMMKSENIYLHDGWRDSPIVPSKTDKKKMRYFDGGCPAAEIISMKVVNLPTGIGITRVDMQRIVSLLKAYLEKEKRIGQD
jgi:dTDP-4-amino-4,6-dideoxygalactose transaminase